MTRHPILGYMAYNADIPNCTKLRGHKYKLFKTPFISSKAGANAIY